jgi:glutamyl-tRNA synthetase
MDKNSDKVYRFAPSPSGYLHVGGARTALFNWLLARKERGKFLLRIEDTDRERSSAESVQHIFQSLTWLGLEWDREPVFQSQNLARHKDVVDQLLDKKKAYFCFCTKEILEEQKIIAREQKISYLYDGRCKKLTSEQVQTNFKEDISCTVRLEIPNGITRFRDGVHGEIGVKNMEIDDFVILRSDKTPVYHLAVVVDDHDMAVTHVVRGDDHLSNTLKQILLYQALDWPIPQFSHLPLILGPDKLRLSKRHGASSVEEFRCQGILPQALFNYLSLLGWAPGDDRELMEKEELIERFSIERVSKANAVFDQQKLIWMNGKYLTQLTNDTIISLLKSGMEKNHLSEIESNFEPFSHLIDLVKERARTMADIKSNIEYFFSDPMVYDEKGIAKYFSDPSSSQILKELNSCLSDVEDFTAMSLEKKIRSYAQEKEMNAAIIIHPLRLALTGRIASPGIFEIIEILGRVKVNRRIVNAISFIGSKINQLV